MATCSSFLPGKSYGQRSLVGYVHGVAKSQTRLSVHTHKPIKCVCACVCIYLSLSRSQPGSSDSQFCSSLHSKCKNQNSALLTRKATL